MSTAQIPPIRVVNLRVEPYDLDIGRGSPWGNPFVIGRDGDRAEVIHKHEAHIMRERTSMTTIDPHTPDDGATGPLASSPYRNSRLYAPGAPRTLAELDAMLAEDPAAFAVTTGPTLPSTPEPGIEYAAFFPASLDAGCDEWDLHTSREPDEAAGLVRFVNKRLAAAGVEPRAIVLERTITYGDWKATPTAGAGDGEE